MSLFPAYALDGGGAKAVKESDQSSRWNVELKKGGETVAVQAAGDAAALEALEEAALLASDSSEEDTPPPATLRQTPTDVDFYIDGRADNANLGVTTLYYPGRPIYKRAEQTLGGAEWGKGKGKGSRRRYYLSPAGPAEPSAAELAARVRAYRDMLAASPHDEELCLAYLRFQEEWCDGASWLAACEEAVRGGAGRAGRERLRAELHRARRAVCTTQDLLKAITSDIHDEKCGVVRLEHWLRLLWTLGGAGSGGCGAGDAAGEVLRAAHAALQALPQPRAYPLVLYVYGSTLRAGGLWEQLVLLVELVCAMNFPRSELFPPPPPAPHDKARREELLREAEDKVISSGLPLSTVWVRVERLRAAAHWRPAGEGEGEGGGWEADPQRAPAAGDMAGVLRAVRPSATLLMCVQLLRLAQAPLLPASAAAQRACGAGDAEEPPALAAALPALLRAARRLPSAAPAPAAALRRALRRLLDPPHCYADDEGYLSWMSALWDACCSWVEGRRRLALACWRLRWLHALTLVAGAGEGEGQGQGAEETRRLRAQARRVLKLHAQGEPLAFALYARIERDTGHEEAARRAALQAVRVSCGDARVERSTALFAARVLREVCGAREPALAAAALCAAVGTRALAGAPEPTMLAEALQECNARCAELERGFESGAGGAAEAEEEADAAAARALTCGAGEWGAARVHLLAPAARRVEEARLLSLGRGAVHRTCETAQYYEACACALVQAAAAEARRGAAARALLPLFPDNALLALAAGAAPVWARAAEAARGLAPASRSRTITLARVLPALLRAPLDDDADPIELSRLARVLGRAAGERGGAVDAALAALRLEVEARAPHSAAPHSAAPLPASRAHRALLAALAAAPNHKWLYVRGAAWAGADADALCDAALERALRLHALTHELRPPPPPPAPPLGPAPQRQEDPLS